MSRPFDWPLSWGTCRAERSLRRRSLATATLGWIALVASSAAACSTARANDAAAPSAADRAADLAAPLVPPPGDLRARAGEHPLEPVLRWAESGLAAIVSIDDYSCNLVKRERVAGALLPHESIFLKVRQRPFSVYAFFLAPQKKRGQEVLFVDGQNEGKLWGHGVGLRDRLAGAVALSPTSAAAMRDNRYPITEVGLANLVARLIAVGTADLAYGECEVQLYSDARINERPCLSIVVTHPHARPHFRFHQARIYIDTQTNLPIRYESYGWPSRTGSAPPLWEEYTYLDVQISRGYGDLDFDMANPAYGFERHGREVSGDAPPAGRVSTAR